MSDMSDMTEIQTWVPSYQVFRWRRTSRSHPLRTWVKLSFWNLMKDISPERKKGICLFVYSLLLHTADAGDTVMAPNHVDKSPEGAHSRIAAVTNHRSCHFSLMAISAEPLHWTCWVIRAPASHWQTEGPDRGKKMSAHTQRHAHSHANAHTQERTHPHKSGTYARTHLLYTHANTHKYTYTCAYTPTHTNTQIHANTHPHIHTQTHPHTHTKK